MSRSPIKESSFDFDSRVRAIYFLAFIMLTLLGVRFYVLQVVRHEDFQLRADNNRIREIEIVAPRGGIYDRNGVPLVANTFEHNIVIVPDAMKDANREETIRVLVEELGAEREQLLGSLNDPKRSKALPILVKQNASDADRAWIAAHGLEHPEIQIELQPNRTYPNGSLAAHVIGYVGEITPRQLENPKYKEGGYKSGDIIGQSGIEAYYDKELRGKNGVKRLLVDSKGNTIDELEVIPPVRGQDLYTTIDIDVQRVAEEEFDSLGQTGSAIAMNPQNGEIYAMVSRPTFDPSLFAKNIASSGEYRAEIRALITDETHPLYNDAMQGIYPTGSTWKLLMSTAALEEKVITPKDSRLPCGGGLRIGTYFMRCMGSHGAPDVHSSIVHSCDGYYYRLGIKLGVDKIHEWVTRFGVGSRTGIDIPGENLGIIPSRETKRRFNPKDPDWRDFDTASATIGQGTVVISPLQLLRAISGVMMGGEFYTPHFLKEAKATPIAETKLFEQAPKIVPLSKQTIDIVSYGAWGVVNQGGTGGRAGIPGFNVGGKTGTAQVISTDKARGKKLQDHAWFIGFAPLHTEQKPEIGIVVLTENGGQGGRASAPKFRMILGAYYSKKAGHAVIPELTAKFAPPQPATQAEQTASASIAPTAVNDPQRPSTRQ